MPRVFIATHEYTGTGAAVMLEAVLLHWAKELGWTVDLFNRFDKPPTIPETLIAAGARPGIVGSPEDYDLVVVNSVAHARLLQWSAREFAARRPALLWVHEGSTYAEFASHRDLDWPKILAAFKRVVFLNNWQRDVVFGALLPNSAASGHAVVLPNGLPPLSGGTTQKSHNSNAQRVVFVGSVYPRKRPDDLALAVERLDRPNLQCMFVGPSQSVQHCSDAFRYLLASRPDRFHLLGEMPRHQVASLLAQADIFCLPSASEVLPLTPLEAAQFNVPVCLSDLPAYADVWSHEENCLKHTVGDITTLASNLHRLLDDRTFAAALANRARSLLPRFAFDRFIDGFTILAQETMAAK